MSDLKVGLIGRGHVGSALQRGLSRAGYEVQAVGKEPEKVRDVALWADTVVLAVPYQERRNAVDELGDAVQGKTVIDVTNAVGSDMEFRGSTKRSGAEELRDLIRDARVVKAFNTVFAQHMDKGNIDGEPLTLFVAGDDEGAKREVVEMGEALGFDAVDAGPLENARWLEPMGYLNIALALKTNLGPESGFRYVHRPASKRGARPAARSRGKAKRRATARA